MKVAARVIGILICLLLVSAFLLQPAGVPSAVAARGLEKPVIDPERDGSISSRIVAPEWTKATREWTAAEMAAAKPYPMPQLEGQPDLLAPQGSSTQNLSGALLKTIPAGLPEGEANLVDLSGLDTFGASGALAPTGYTYPPPFTRYIYYGRYSKEYPYKTIGRLFFVQYGTAYVCSAASIGGYAIWTAGHCVHAGNGDLNGGWSYYTMFLPGYDSGRKPGGQWFGVNLWTKARWAYYGDLAYDMGGVILGTSKRKSISQKVGWLGFAYTPDSSGYYAQYHWTEIGYPAASPFDGQKQVVCSSSYAYSDTSFSPYPVGVGCDQTGGTSGGPWILNFWPFAAGGSVNLLNGNMSYRYVNPNHPQEIFSPYFGSAAYDLWYALVTDVP